MKRFDLRWLVVSSLLVAAVAAEAETRPLYGGTLHVTTRATLSSLDPADNAQPDSFARRSITFLMFESLVATDDDGHPHAVLATSWQSSPNQQHWQFHIRRGVKFHDGTPLTPEIAAASIRSANPTWNVSSGADSVVIDIEGSDPGLLAGLALPRNAIAKRSGDKPVGTGPFHVNEWQGGKKLTLGAEEGYWRGRPFLDAIEIEMGKNYRDQTTALEMGRADVVEVAPEQTHRVVLQGHRFANSGAMELLSLVFTRDPQTAAEKSLREALGWSIERLSIRNVLLQGAGQPAGGILPNGMSGYAFVFPTGSDLVRARHAREALRTIPTWTLAYDGNDPLARLLAERIALNGKDGGLLLQPTSAATGDVRLVRIQLPSSDSWVALSDVARIAGLPAPKRTGGAIEDLYTAEQAVLATQRIIPLFHLPATYAASNTLRNWTVRPDGVLNLSDAWLGSGKP